MEKKTHTISKHFHRCHFLSKRRYICWFSAGLLFLILPSSWKITLTYAYQMRLNHSLSRSVFGLIYARVCVTAFSHGFRGCSFVDCDIIVNNWTWQWHTLVSISMGIERGDALSRRSSSFATKMCLSQIVSQRITFEFDFASLGLASQFDPFSIKTDGFLIMPHFNTAPHFQFNWIRFNSDASLIFQFDYMLRQLNYFQMRTHNPKRTETTPHSFRVNVCVFFLLVCAYLFFLLPCVCSCDYDFGDKVWRNYLATLKYILIWWFVLIADVWGADNVKKRIYTYATWIVGACDRHLRCTKID